MSRNQPTEMTPDRIACHEAGHAVGSFIVRRAIQTVSIVGDGKTHGGYVSHPTRNWYPAYRKVHGMGAWVPNTPPRMGPKKLQKEVDILLSGAAAEIAHFGGLFPWASAQDFELAVGVATELADRYGLPPTYPVGSGPTAKLLRDLVRDLECPDPIAKFLIERFDCAFINIVAFSGAVWLLMEELLQRQEISGRRARAIIKSTLDANGLPRSSK